MTDTTSESRAAFDQLLDTLRECADRYAGPEWGLTTPDDPRAGCARSRTCSKAGSLGHFEDDPRQPVFRQIVTSTRKSMGDNADAIYFDAAVSSRVRVPRAREDRGRDVRVVHGRSGRGRRRVPRSHRRRAERHASSTSTPTATSRSILGGAPRDRNWIALDPDASRITTRHYWEQERSPAIPPIPDLALEIEVVGGLPPLPPPTRRVGRRGLATGRALRAVALARADAVRVKATSPRSCRASRTRFRRR